MAKTFVCDREGTCEEGERGSPTVRQRRVKLAGRTREEACRAEAEAFFSDDRNLGHSEVEVTVDDD